MMANSARLSARTVASIHAVNPMKMMFRTSTAKTSGCCRSDSLIDTATRAPSSIGPCCILRRRVLDAVDPGFQHTDAAGVGVDDLIHAVDVLILHRLAPLQLIQSLVVNLDDAADIASAFGVETVELDLDRCGIGFNLPGETFDLSRRFVQRDLVTDGDADHTGDENRDRNPYHRVKEFALIAVADIHFNRTAL